VCTWDCEAIAAKWGDGRYVGGVCSTASLKIKNPKYARMVGRREVFEMQRAERH
jgi:hypothetical protein